MSEPKRETCQECGGTGVCNNQVRCESCTQTYTCAGECYPCGGTGTVAKEEK